MFKAKAVITELIYSSVTNIETYLENKDFVG